MNYNPKTGRLEISPRDAEQALHCFMHALRHIRLAAGLTLDRYDRPGPLENADHAGLGILDGMKALGMDLGVHWPSELDLRQKDDLPPLANKKGEDDDEYGAA